jgi:hypothetical protein
MSIINMPKTVRSRPGGGFLQKVFRSGAQGGSPRLEEVIAPARRSGGSSLLDTDLPDLR